MLHFERENGFYSNLEMFKPFTGIFEIGLVALKVTEHFICRNLIVHKAKNKS